MLTLDNQRNAVKFSLGEGDVNALLYTLLVRCLGKTEISYFVIVLLLDNYTANKHVSQAIFPQSSSDVINGRSVDKSVLLFLSVGMRLHFYDFFSSLDV